MRELSFISVFLPRSSKEGLVAFTCFVKGKKVFGRSLSSMMLIAADYFPSLVLLFIA